MSETRDDELLIFTPPVADETDLLDNALVTLTAAARKALPDEDYGFGLGGENGYGVNYENDVFMMHRYCWCERDDCPWCGECGCVPDAEEYVDGERVESWYAATKDMILDYPHDVADFGTAEYKEASRKFDEAIKKRDARIKVIYPAFKHTCGRPWAVDMPRREDFGESQSAPNFWHKASGLKVWWYKWIGRDMQVAGMQGVDLSAVFNECLASLPTNKEGKDGRTG